MAEQMFRVRNAQKKKIEVHWDGVPYPLDPGESQVVSAAVADHLQKYFPDVERTAVEAKYEEPGDPTRGKFTDPASGRTFDTMTELVAFIEERARLGAAQAGARAMETGNVSTAGNNPAASPNPVVSPPGGAGARPRGGNWGK